MKLPDNPETADRSSTRAWILLLAVLSTVPASGSLPEASPAAELRVVSAEAEPCLSVRQRPSRRARIVDCLDRGSRVSVTGTRGVWSRVETAGGIGGWVDSDLLAAAPVAAEAAASGEPERSAEPPAPAAQTPPAAQMPPAAPKPSEAQEPPATQMPAAAPKPSEAQGLPAAQEGETAQKATVRIVVASDGSAGLAASTGRSAPEGPVQTGPERDQLAEQTRIAEDRTAALASERDQLAERARIAEERAAALEAELAETRDPQGSGGAEASDLAARVDELTRERDDLARQLAQAEARSLYLLSDLERTRAELMQLKGIPARLVQPEADPEPVAVQPEPAPEPSEAAEPAALAPLVTPPFMSLEAVVGTVRAWAQAWADRRADDYLAFYSDSFTPADGESRETWAARRRERILAPRSIVITLDRINPIVSGDRATVTFVQSYVSETFSDTVSKTLVLERVSGATWQIVEERAE